MQGCRHGNYEQLTAHQILQSLQKRLLITYLLTYLPVFRAVPRLCLTLRCLLLELAVILSM